MTPDTLKKVKAELYKIENLLNDVEAELQDLWESDDLPMGDDEDVYYYKDKVSDMLNDVQELTAEFLEE